MPSIKLSKKTIHMNDKTKIVYDTFHKVLELSQLNLITDKEKEAKEKLDVTEEKKIPGAWATIKRALGFNAATCEMHEMNLTFEELPYTLYLSLEKILVEEVTKDFTYLKNNNERDNKINFFDCHVQAVKCFTATTIENSTVLICEMLLRLIAVALSEEFMTDKICLENSDKYITILESFIELLMSDSENIKSLFSGEGLVTHRKSTFGFFLRQSVQTQWVTLINDIIVNVKKDNSPKFIFEQTSATLNDIRITIRALITIFMSKISKELFNKELIMDESQLNTRVVTDISFSCLLSEVERLVQDTYDKKNSSSVLESTAVVLTLDSQISSDQHELMHKKNARRYGLIVSDFYKIASAPNLVGSSQIDFIKPMLQKLDALLMMDVELDIIDSARSLFADITVFSGWIPIIVGAIRPEFLSYSIDTFILRHKKLIEGFSKDISDLNSDTIIGFLKLSPPCWDDLSKASQRMHALINPKIIESIKDKIQNKLRMLDFIIIQLIEKGLLHKSQVGNNYLDRQSQHVGISSADTVEPAPIHLTLNQPVEEQKQVTDVEAMNRLPDVKTRATRHNASFFHQSLHRESPPTLRPPSVQINDTTQTSCIPCTIM